MKVHSLRFGTVELAEDRLLRFVRPVVGFDQLGSYGVIEDPDSAPVLWLQAVDAPEVLFPAIDASLVAGDYGVDLDDEAVAELGLDRAADARLLCILTLSPDPTAVTVNLRAPIVWNTRRATALQVVLQDTEVPVSVPVRAAAGASRCNKEVARAGSNAPQR